MADVHTIMNTQKRIANGSENTAVQSTVRNDRIASLDAFRVPAILAVICLHTIPFFGSGFEDPRSQTLGFLVNQISRFAVPYFFIVSGYLFGKKIRGGEPVRLLVVRYTKRLLRIFVFWTCFYLVAPLNLGQIRHVGLLRNVYWKVCMIWEQPVRFILEGSSTHLWFLTSLMIGLWITGWFVSRGRGGVLFFLSAGMYAFYVLYHSYYVSLSGVNPVFQFRDGPFISCIFLSVGWYLSSERFRPGPALGWGLMLSGVVLSIIELGALKELARRWVWCEYVFGTALFSTGLVIYLLAGADIRKENVIARMGRYTLGIYVCHQIFVRLLRPIGDFLESYAWELSFPVMVYGFSLGLTWLCIRNQKLKPFFI